MPAGILNVVIPIPALDLLPGYTVTFEAADPLGGGINLDTAITDITLYVSNDEAADDGTTGPFMYVHSPESTT